MMKIPQESCCRCHFLSPSKERIIHSYPDKVHNYGYGSVQFRIQTVTDKTGSCRSVLVPILHFRMESTESYYFWKIVKTSFKKSRKNQKNQKKNNLKK